MIVKIKVKDDVLEIRNEKPVTYDEAVAILNAHSIVVPNDMVENQVRIMHGYSGENTDEELIYSVAKPTDFPNVAYMEMLYVAINLVSIGQNKAYDVYYNFVTNPDVANVVLRHYNEMASDIASVVTSAFGSATDAATMGYVYESDIACHNYYFILPDDKLKPLNESVFAFLSHNASDGMKDVLRQHLAQYDATCRVRIYGFTFNASCFYPKVAVFSNVNELAQQATVVGDISA